MDHPTRHRMRDMPRDRILKLLETEHHVKWGFVIYRCTYGDDDAWKQFMNIWTERTEDALRHQDALDLKDSLAWTVKSDPSLNGASVDQVRDLFNEWKHSDEARSEVPALPEGAMVITPPGMSARSARRFVYGMDSPRYMFCIHVDSDSMASVIRQEVRTPNLNWSITGYVTIVDSWWDREELERLREQDMEELRENLEADEELDPEEIEPIGEGGYMRVYIDGLLPSKYSTLDVREMWGYQFVDPPEIWD